VDPKPIAVRRTRRRPPRTDSNDQPTDTLHPSERPDDGQASPNGPPQAIRTRRESSPAGGVKRAANRWARTIHVYTSMVALLIVLFFGLTGITLNHPSWTFGDGVDTSTYTGTLPFPATRTDSDIDYLAISEFARHQYGVLGDVTSFDTTNGQGRISYANPGYSATISFTVDTGNFEVAIEQQGWIAVVNDLHKGRNADSSWRWVIDASGGFLVIIAISGLVMQLFLRRRRRSAVLGAAAGAVLVLILAVMALR
jgi:uncharacterized protein